MDLATAQSHLDNWLAADLAVSTGQAYTIGQRSLTRADAAQIREQIQYWQGQINILARRASGVRNPMIILPKWS